MAVTIKSKSEIAIMREAGMILAKVHKELEKSVKAGMSTFEVDALCEKLIKGYGAIPSCKGYEGFPGSICVSINDEIVHGIPRKDKIIKDGDLVSLDFCVLYKGWQSDGARTLQIGEVSPEAKQLNEVTKQCFYEGIKYAKAGNHLYDISAAINDYADSFGYGVIRELVGHGIGKEMHEDPQIPNFRQRRRGLRLEPGMTLCIEPMISMGRPEIVILDDDWTVLTEDGSLASHYENTILITDGEPEILTPVESL